VTDFMHRLGGEATAHADTSGVQAMPAVAALSSGGYVVAWMDANSDGSGFSIRAQRFDSSGAKAGAELAVNGTTFENQTGPTIVGLPSGGFAVAWVHESQTGGDGVGASIRGRVFGADGAALGDDFLVNTTAAGQQMAPSLLALAGGGFVASWHGPLPGGDNFEIVAQRFSAAGAKVGDEFRANTIVADGQDYPSGSGLEGGGYVLVWSHRSGATGDNDDVRGQRFDAAGNAVGAEFLLSADNGSGITTGRQYAPDVASLPGGGFVAVWQSFNSALGRFEARGQIFGSDGARIGSEFTASNAADDASNVSVAAFSWGGFVVGWDNAAMSSPSERAQLFDADGSRLGDQVQLNLGALGLLPGLDLAITAGGRLVSVWQNNAPDVKVQLFTAGLYGTPGADTLTGTADDDLVLGFGGDDDLEGGGGADDLRGGDGIDWIDGGAGIDILTGGAGGDVYLIYAADGAFEDSIVELAGGGWDQIRTTLPSFSLAGLAEVESLFGIAADVDFTLTGNDGDNYIIGNAGDDSLEGGLGDDKLEGQGGADTMRGGQGDDEYVVTEIGDVVEENAGEGTDLVWTSLATYSLFGTQVENLFAVSDVAHDLRGSAAGNVIFGSNSNDFLRLQDGGDDEAYGADGNDVILFGAAMTWTDYVEGGDGLDQLALQGNYVGGAALLFGGGVVGIENIAILPGDDTRFGDPGTHHYDYQLTLQDPTVTAGVQMVVDANRLRAGEDLTFDGSGESDGSFFIYGGGGTDILFGGANNDVFLFGAWGQWNPADVVVGGSGIDQLALRGNYSLTFGAGQLFGIENIGLLSAHDTRFGALGSSYSYDLTMVDGNVASGVQMVVDGAKLRVAEFFRFDGSAELDGSFRVFGGLVDDTIIASRNNDFLQGNGGIDTLTGGLGADIFRYLSASDSAPGSADKILDFTPGTDKIDLSRIDANTHAASDQAFSWIGSNTFTGNGPSSAGELRAYQSGQSWFVEGDTDGDGDADLLIDLTLVGPTPLGGGDFTL
jgi:Ca2+-binding RTX toxin-like protein